MRLMQVTWAKCTGNVWCGFEKVNLSKVSAHGVYLIGCGLFDTRFKTVRTVYVGQGDVGRRTKDHRNDPRITAYSGKGAMYVTWAEVSEDLDGLERYLADELDPLEGSNHPDVTPVEANVPGGWV